MSFLDDLKTVWDWLHPPEAKRRGYKAAIITVAILLSPVLIPAAAIGFIVYGISLAIEKRREKKDLLTGNQLVESEAAIESYVYGPEKIVLKDKVVLTEISASPAPNSITSHSLFHRVKETINNCCEQPVNGLRGLAKRL